MFLAFEVSIVMRLKGKIHITCLTMKSGHFNSIQKVPISNCIAILRIVKISARGTSRGIGPVRNSLISLAQQTVPYRTNGRSQDQTFSFTCRKHQLMVLFKQITQVYCPPFLSRNDDRGQKHSQ